MIRPTVARVDLNALKTNYRYLAAHVAADESRQTTIIAVVKANAYGHGAAQVAGALEDAGATTLACADLEEGATPRAAGARAGILLFRALLVIGLHGLLDCP